MFRSAFSSVACFTFTALSLSGQTSLTRPDPATFRASAATAVSAPQPSTPARLISPETRGDIFMARKMYREAIEEYSEGPTRSAVILNKTGIAYHQMLDLAAAKKYYRAAVKTDPRYAEAINNLGTIEFSQKNYRRAIGLYKRAIRISPESASIYGNLATGYFMRKDYKAAAISIQKALALDPEVFEHRGTSGVLLQQQSVDERAKYHYFLAKSYAEKGDNERALLCMRKALEEGFKDKKKFQQDPEFMHLRDTLEFKELLAMEYRVL